MKKIYFDNAATTPVERRVLEAMYEFSREFFGNPSSVHSYGRKVKVKLEEAREICASFINADVSEIYFTSGGTEANNFIVRGVSQTLSEDYNVSNIFSTEGEHPSVSESLKYLERLGIEYLLLKLISDSSLNLNELSNVKNENSFFSVIHTNNETGAKNDLTKIVQKLNVDALSASAHKIGGPKGTGLAYVKNGTPISQLIFGGSQERNRRGGTENIAGIIGFAEAVKIAEKEMNVNSVHVNNLKNVFSKELKNIFGDDVSFNGGNDSSPYILSVTFNPEIYKNDAEAMLMFFDVNGIALSAGSACSSGTLKPSHVITAARRNEEEAKSTLRISFGKENKLEEVDYALEIFLKFKNRFAR